MSFSEETAQNAYMPKPTARELMIGFAKLAE